MNWSCLKKVNGFNREIANLMAVAAEDSYLINRSDQLNTKWGCEVTEYSSGGTQFITIDGDALIISFRGTEPNRIEDVLSDMDVRKRPINHGHTVLSSRFAGQAYQIEASRLYVHYGFLKAYRQVSRKVESIIFNSNKPVFIGAHSLGGGIGNICMLDLALKGMYISRLYSFGCPRSLGWAAAQYMRNELGGKVFRVVNRNDIVPRVPVPVRFQHCGTLAYIDRHNKIQSNPTLTHVTCDRIAGYRANIFRSHLMKHYIEGTMP
jgi:triacylglycerol lipase